MKLEKDSIFYRKLWSLMIPIVLQNLMLAMVAVADAFMLGGMNQNYMSAVSLATQIQFIQNMFLAAATASLGILGAQYWGKGDIKTLDDIFCMALRLCGMVSVVFFIGCVFFGKYLMLIFTNESVLIGYGVSYLKIAGCSYLLTGISQCYLVIMKTSEHAKTTAIISSFTVCVNIILNWIFIYGAFGLEAMGVKGAALATVIAQGVSTCFVIHYLIKPTSQLKLRLKNIRFERKLLLPCILLGTSPALMQLTENMVAISFNTSLQKYGGDIAVASMSILTSIMQFVMLLLPGLVQGAQPLLSYNLGAKNISRVKKTYYSYAV